MVESSKRPKIVGNFIRERREQLGLSQRALGLLFNPPVTTQFISNVERGVTPLPPAHIPTLTKALNVSDAEITALLEKEYTFKLSDRLGRAPDVSTSGNGTQFSVAEVDANFMRHLYEAYARADTKTRQTFHNVCESVLNIRKGLGSAGGRSDA
jgi:transcriptional regulator with XRE-family HTH domain